jgi:hypothetical protein
MRPCRRYWCQASDSRYALRALLHGEPGNPVSTSFVEDPRVSTDEQNVALPQLYGAPAYARPPAVAPAVERPFDPDELPIEALRTDEEREFTSTLPPRAYAPGGVTLGRQSQSTTSAGGDGSRSRAFKLRKITGRLFGGS